MGFWLARKVFYVRKGPILIYYPSILFSLMNAFWFHCAGIRLKEDEECPRVMSPKLRGHFLGYGTLIYTLHHHVYMFLKIINIIWKCVCTYYHKNTDACILYNIQPRTSLSITHKSYGLISLLSYKLFNTLWLETKVSSLYSVTVVVPRCGLPLTNLTLDWLGNNTALVDR